MQWQQKSSLAVLDQFGGNSITAWGFLKGQAVYGGFSIELFHDRLRQALDDIKGCGRHNNMPGVEVGIVFHPSLHLLSLVCNNFHSGGFEGVVLFCTGPVVILVPLYIPVMFPVIAADWMVSLSSVQYSLAQHLVVCWALFLAAWRLCRFLSLGDRLYSARAGCLASMMGVVSEDFASNQSCDFEVFLPTVAKAMRCMVSRRVAHFSVAESPVYEAWSSFSNLSANCSTRSGWKD